MANYRLVSNAMFRPFSFEEYVKPYLMYGEAYKEMEMNISDLEEKAGKWDKLANELTDPKTHATYKAYADELRALADLLSRYGMSPLLRRRAAVMRGRYAEEIEPIEVQYNKRELLRLELHQMQVAANGSLRFDNDYGNMSLDTMLENPNMTYDFVSGDKIASEAAARVLAVAKDRGEKISLDTDEKGNIKGLGIPQHGEYPFYTSTKIKGLTLEDAEKAIRRDADADPYLLLIWDEIEQLYKEHPAYNSEWAKPYIARGIREGVLGRESSMINNPGYAGPLPWAQQAENVRHNKASEAIQHESNAISERNNIRSTSALRYGARLSYLLGKEGHAIEKAKLGIQLAASGFKLDKNNNVVEMTASERKSSPLYQSALNVEGQRKAVSISGGTGLYVSVAANKQGEKLQAHKDKPAVKYRDLKTLLKDLLSGKLELYTFNERGSLMGVGGLASHAQTEIAKQLKKWGDVVKPEHFVYAVTVGPTGSPKEAVLIPIELLPLLELSDKK